MVVVAVQGAPSRIGTHYSIVVIFVRKPFPLGFPAPAFDPPEQSTPLIVKIQAPAAHQTMGRLLT
jgi:hypothetical protein